MADPKEEGPVLPRELRDRFRIERLLGRGAMGTVLLATDRELSREVAIKLGFGARGPSDSARFVREASTLAALKHPRIPRLYSFGVGDEGAWMVQEYVAGPSLAHGPGERHPVALMLEVAEALEAIHAAELVHRDVKPGNVVRGADGHPYLVDFGLVYDAHRSRLTRTHQRVGTPSYVAPEALVSDDPVAASDWYGWGATLYFLLEGHAPFRIAAVMDAAIGKPLPPLEFSRQEPLPGVLRVLEACLARDPALRPRGIAALKELLGAGPWSPPPSSSSSGSAVSARPGPGAAPRGAASPDARVPARSPPLAAAPSRPLPAARGAGLPVLAWAVLAGLAWWFRPVPAPRGPSPAPVWPGPEPEDATRAARRTPAPLPTPLLDPSPPSTPSPEPPRPPALPATPRGRAELPGLAAGLMDAARFRIKELDGPEDVAAIDALLAEAARVDPGDGQARYARFFLDGRQRPPDPARGIALLEAAIAAGSDKARIHLAEILVLGQHLPADRDRALALLDQAAPRRPAEAYHAMGLIYLNERLGPVEPARAFAFLTAAYRAGDAHAGMRTIAMLEAGHGTPRDPEEAARRVAKLASIGYGPAMARTRTRTAP